jgi:hypothetical protein
VSVYTEIEKLD